MKQKNNNIKLIFLFLILGLSILLPKTSRDFFSEEVETQEVEERIQNLVDYTIKDSPQLLKTFSSDSFPKNFKSKNRIYDIVIEENNNFTYWTTNKLNFSLLRNVKQADVYTLSNRLFLIWLEIQNTKKIYYLIPLEKKFKINNNYLINEAFPNIKLPSCYSFNIKGEADKKISIRTPNATVNFFLETKAKPQVKSLWKWTFLLTYLFSIVLLSLFIFKRIYSHKSLSIFQKLGLWFAFLAFLLSLQPQYIPFSDSFRWFQPYSFANQYIHSSAHLLLLSIWWLILIFSTVQLLSYHQFKIPQYLSLILHFLSLLYLWLIIYASKNIIVNSTCNFLDFESLFIHFHDVVFLIVFGVLLYSYYTLLTFILKIYPLNSRSKQLNLLLYIYLPYSIILLIFKQIGLLTVLFTLINIYILNIKTNPHISPQFYKLIKILIGSFFIVSFVKYESVQKEESHLSLRLESFQNENNRLAEFLLKEVDQKIDQDSLLLDMVNQLPYSEERIFDYIQDQYLSGFWSRFWSHFRLELTICGTADFFEMKNSSSACQIFFNNKIDKNSSMIPNSHFYSIHDKGAEQYLGIRRIINQNKDSIDIYMHLKPLGNDRSLGYPSIILTKEVINEYTPSFYSLAKYINGTLVKQKGAYHYNLKCNHRERGANNGFYEKSGYTHYYEELKPGIINVISFKKQSLFDFFLAVSYTFILFTILFFIVDLIYLFLGETSMIELSLKDKLRISFVAVLSLSFLATAISIILKSEDLATEKQKQFLEEKINSIVIELEDKFSEKKLTDPLNFNELTYWLSKLSNTFFTDINVYLPSGELLLSSRQEVFEKELIGKYMNPIAFQKMSKEHESEFIHNENIGKQDYLSAYKPLILKGKDLIAYVNLPYFKRNEFNESVLTTLITSFLNIFVLLFLTTVFFTIFISNRISMPLAVIRGKLRNLRLEGKNEIIEYHSHDEIGDLVREYNRTVLELNKSIEMLAQKEREGAWKEMAKQIAHEIKNPLTPMKLSLQHLEYISTHSAPDKDEKLKRTINIVVNQIDQLAEIASAFSDFSRMTTAKKVHFCLKKLIAEQVQLFSGKAQFKTAFDQEKELYVFADKQQITRVLQNLFSNAIQAVPENRKAQIILNIEERKDLIICQISDNGKGIDPVTQKKMFEPNFTTKNSGMGMGLAIVKEIINNNSGEINFKTEEGKGTCFSFSLPKYK